MKYLLVQTVSILSFATLEDAQSHVRASFEEQEQRMREIYETDPQMYLDFQHNTVDGIQVWNVLWGSGIVSGYFPYFGVIIEVPA